MPHADVALAKLYQPRIREHAARVRRDKRLDKPDVTVTCRSPVCGSVMTLDLIIHDGILAKIGWKGRACTLGMASLSIVTCAGIGQTEKEIFEVGRRLSDLLNGKKNDFPQAWADLSIFCAAQEFPMRFGSIELPFDAIAQAYEKVR
ncbi:iron-sulfur cluster assembly scaffold protein [Lentibacter sp. XHP0401]|jgi:NifU-like protein involved in Fe-S cluster formation|uniref:iron-sulfur cluster assembly scaffold protein n=1 Tax=Lentibacter sp. XHP0401 TaxID=2984334 RepID=UPI0021E87F41|nr:iron-sulfur cluster assembly scaffold protein [Lentibacter sp. XHP0401]MCV2892731.1 iron-sulfur cluster assembly scaffold protein [Lentibacter sp. XHP0401]